MNNTLVQNGGELDIRTVSELDEAFALCDNIVTKKYLSSLEQLKLVEPSRSFLEKPIFEQASLFNIQKIVYDKEESSLQKLVNTYASAAGTNNSIVMVVTSDGRGIDLYLGTTGADEVSSARAAADALRNNFVGNFPGSLGDEDKNSGLLDNRLLEALLDSSTNKYSVSCVSGVGSVREDEEVKNERYIQGIEKMIDTMQGTPFSAIFIANSLGQERLDDIRAEYEILYSQLAPFLKSELSFNESSSDGVSKTLSESLSTTLTHSKSSALSVGTSESKAHTEGGATTHTDTLSVSHTSGISASAYGIGASRSTTVGYSHSISRTKSWADTTTFGTTKSQTNTIGDSEAKGEIRSIADGTTKTETTGRSLQITYTNRTVQQLLDTIDEQLDRIKDSTNYGVFAVAAYFFASTPMASKMAASSYKGLINGNCTHVENANISTWYDKSDVDIIKQYVSRLHHPVFMLDKNNQVTPASVVSGKELAVQMGLPRKSVPGVSVIETAPFGRNLEHIRGRRYINIGNMYHMGREDENISVELDIDSLTMHTFVTGSTGSGKSNAVYTLLEKILQRNADYEDDISFMVIEPAKGEYKDVFGNRKDVRVLGTNSKISELLKINPFSFPDEIHILEHIDRLIEIFNVCWPMYAAMPAVLKDAVERAYVNAGWNLESSECLYRGVGNVYIYPTFADVLGQISVVMDESRYSADSKGDYVGALSTRIKSLTNGLYGQIFTPAELSSEELFDKNIIVDLSRVGSVETKSLIMGLLVLKMQEYRMSSRKGNNSRLKHLTVLEEAHNLLKRTSTEQSADSSNLLGKSVEMLANAIAEMRTFGEGFVIADQAPGLLDMSVIRNTNTKIILRLPDMEDRELVGRAASLNDNQILELSKLKTGVAAIYQNNWLEPILCKVYRFSSKEEPYKYVNSQVGAMQKSMSTLLDYMLAPASKKLEFDSNMIKMLERSVFKLNISADTKISILRYIKEKNVSAIERLRSRIVYDIFNSETALSLTKSERCDVDSWCAQMVERLVPDISDRTNFEQERILTVIAKEQAERTKTKEDVELFDNLVHFIKARRM